MDQNATLDQLVKEAELAVVKKDYPFAMERLQQVVTEDPTNLEAHYLLGICLVRLGQTDEALYHFEEILNSSYVFLYINHVRCMMGYIYTKKEEYNKAKSYLEKAIQVEPRNTFALSMLAYAHHRTHNIELAIDLYSQVINLEPENYNAKNCIGYIEIEQKRDIDFGIRLCEEALTLAPDNPSIMDSLGWGYYLKGDNDRAVEYLRKAYDLAPESKDIKEHLREILAL